MQKAQECGTLGLGYGDGNNRFKFECSKCSLVSILTIKTRRSSATEEYMPKYIARFYNPVKQNNTHIRSLKECLGLNTKFHSIVVFGSRATLKVINNIPHNTHVVSGNNLGNALNSIANTQDEFLRENEVIEICKKINSKRLLYDESLKSEHIESIHGLTGGR